MKSVAVRLHCRIRMLQNPIFGSGQTQASRGRADQDWSQRLASAAERGSRGPRIERRPCQCRQLPWLAHHQPDHRGDIGRAIRTHRSQGDLRQRADRRIGNHPDSGHRYPMVRGDLSDDVGFHIHGNGPGPG